LSTVGGLKSEFAAGWIGWNEPTRCAAT
jgi:hypothetical protein